MIVHLRLAARLSLREMRGSIREFYLFLACLALGVAAIAGVGSVSEAMRAGIARDAGLLLGGDVSIRLNHREMPAAAVAALAGSGRLSQVVSMRAMARPVEGGRTVVELKAVDGAYPLFGAVTLVPALPLAQALEARDGVMGAVVDPALMRRLDLIVGSRLHIGAATFEVRAEILREPDRTVRFATFGPRVMIAGKALAATGLVTAGSLIAFEYRVDLPDETDVADWRRALNARFPKAGWHIHDTSDAAPGFDRFIERVARYLTLVGLSTLLVGGVGISGAVRSFLERRTATIATLKCLGAPAALVFTIYMLQVMILATLGIAIGVTVGAAAPMLAGHLLAGMLPASLPLAVYWQPLLIAGLFGYLTALAFAVWPLGRARDVRAAHLFRALIVPPRSLPRPVYIVTCGLTALALVALTILATDDSRLAVWFLLGTFGVLLLFGGGTALLLRQVRKLPAPRRPDLRLAIANLNRPGSPAPGIVLSLGLGLTVMVTIALLQASLSHQINRQMPEEAPSYYFIDIQPLQADAVERLARSIDGVTRFERTPMVRGRVVRIAGTPVEEVTPDQDVAWAVNGDRGFTYAAAKPEAATLVEGDWWPEDYTGPPLISFDANVARGLKIGLGDSITLNVLGREIKARIANLRHIDWATLGMNFVFVFAPGVLEQAPHSVIAAVYADGLDAEEAVHQAVTDAFPNLTAIAVKDALENAGRILDAAAIAIRLTAAVTLLAGVLVLSSSVVTGQHRRVYDAVVLKVLGARRRNILTAYLLEFAILGLFAGVVAAAAGTVIGRFLSIELMRAEFVFDPLVILLTVVASLVCTTAFGLTGTWRALGQKAGPLLRND